METTMNRSLDPFEGYTEKERIDLCSSINQASEEVRQGRFYEFNDVFDELEGRFAYE